MSKNRKETLDDQKNLTPAEKRKIEQQVITELDPEIKNNSGSFILDETSLPQEIPHAVGTIKINDEKIRYYGLQLYQNVIKFNNKTKQEYVVKQRVPCILTEKGQLFSEYEKPKETNFIFGSVMGAKQNRITLDTIKKFTKREHKEVTFKEVYEGFKERYEYFMVFERREWYEFNALWDLATYFQDLINYFLIIKHEGGSGTAKSKGMKISSQLAFNGKSFLCPTPASFFRYRNNNKSMLCIEEAERLFDNNKKSSNSDNELVEYLNGSYEKGNTVPRQNDKDLNQTDEFDPSGFTRIGAINELRGALRNRSVPLVMIKARPNDPRSEREVPTNTKEKHFQELRNKAYILGLTKYQDYEKATREAKNCSGLHNREWLVSKPIIALAGLIDKELQERIGRFLNSLFYIRQDGEDEDSWEIILATILIKRTVKYSEEVFISNEELVTAFQKELSDRGQEGRAYNLTSHGITKILSKLSLKEFKGRNKKGDERGINIDFFCLSDILLRNEKLTFPQLLKKVSEVSERQITDEKIRGRYADTFTDKKQEVSEISDKLTDLTLFRGVGGRISEQLLNFVSASKKPLEIDFVKKQNPKPEEFDFEEWLTVMKRDGKLYEPKRGFVTVI